MKGYVYCWNEAEFSFFFIYRICKRLVYCPFVYVYLTVLHYITKKNPIGASIIERFSIEYSMWCNHWKEKLEKTLFILINIRSNEYLEIQQETILYSSYVDDKLMIVIELIKLVSFFFLSPTIELIVG